MQNRKAKQERKESLKTLRPYVFFGGFDNINYTNVFPALNMIFDYNFLSRKKQPTPVFTNRHGQGIIQQKSNCALRIKTSRTRGRPV